MVRLKGVCALRGAEHLFQFQFHSGSIKSWQDDGIVYFEGEFQFHSGSIKSQYQKADDSWADSFNSIVVRLKAKAVEVSAAEVSDVSIP